MMTELQAFLKTLISASGLSGHEQSIRRLIDAEWRPLADHIQVSRLGSLQAVRHGTGLEPRRSVLLAAHMDAIGIMVTGITDGFLRLTQIGGIDPRVLPGQLVTVHGRQDLPGIIVQPPSNQLPSEFTSSPVPLYHLLIDVGLEPRQIARLVRVGDLVSFAQPPIELSTDILVGHSLDNRASVAAVTHCLEILQNRRLTWDVWAVATTQEEETFGGAGTSVFELRPALTIAIDVTFGASPGSPGHKSFPVSQGITLGWGPNIHPALYQVYKELAERLEIPYKMEVMPQYSGTDAFAMQVAAEGVPTMVVSIPLRYMHTPVEMVSMQDIRRVGRLLAEFAAQLDESFMDRLAWDD
jgi:putative aminopeptidase FrvX